MAALQEFLDEHGSHQERAAEDGKRRRPSPRKTDGDLRDTLLARWEELDAKTKPLIERMEKIQQITRTAEDPANLEAPYGTGRRRRRREGSPTW